MVLGRQVVRLDVIMAKTRYGDWIEGCLPTFVPFSFAFHRGQGGSAAKSGRKGKRLAAEVAEDEEQLYIQMKRLRCSAPCSLYNTPRRSPLTVLFVVATWHLGVTCTCGEESMVHATYMSSGEAVHCRL